MQIITHSGQAHRDEFMACCLLLAHAADSAGYGNPKFTAVLRRDATPAELDDQETLVLDQGGRYEPILRNFDHHQFGRNMLPTCSITLILPVIGIDPDVARKYWNWLEFSERLDSKGPKATAAWLGIDAETMQLTMSPIETTILRWFGEQNGIAPASPLWGLMVQIGREKLEYLQIVRKQIEVFGASSALIPREQHYLLDLRALPAATSLAGLEIFIKEIGRDCPVTICRDDRGPGLALYRRNDDPRYDFSKLEGRPEIAFAHKNGFIAKTNELGVDPVALVDAARV